MRSFFSIYTNFLCGGKDIESGEGDECQKFEGGECQIVVLKNEKVNFIKKDIKMNYHYHLSMLDAHLKVMVKISSELIQNGWVFFFPNNFQLF